MFVKYLYSYIVYVLKLEQYFEGKRTMRDVLHIVQPNPQQVLSICSCSIIIEEDCQ